MEVFILGAGRPVRGQNPPALKKIAFNTRALDWQLYSFDPDQLGTRIHFLGGFHIEQVVKSYPQLSFTVVPDWESTHTLHTLLHAAFPKDSCIFTYSDTVFRKELIRKLSLHGSDVAICIDSEWESRYQFRTQQDKNCAEKINLGDFGEARQRIVEFTGLIRFSERVSQFLSSCQESKIGRNLIDLIHYLKAEGFHFQVIDVAGDWAEFNSPADIAHFILGTKAESLARLEPMVKHSRIGKQISFTVEAWQTSSETVMESIHAAFSNAQVVVRSSAKREDGWHASMAGKFVSMLNVSAREPGNVSDAIDAVIESYGESSTNEDQILVQEFIRDIKISGVVFTCGLETGAPYYRFNFDDKTASTKSVTSGLENDLRTILISRYRPEGLLRHEPTLLPVLKAVHELEQLLGFDKLDIEFAVGWDDIVHIFQVRPITVDHSEFECSDEVLEASLRQSTEYFSARQSASPFVLGDFTVFGNMPDWNPAEIIGARPRPLAFSLYRYLITDRVWGQQRAEFGYRNILPHPLIVSFSGQPYVDVRASLNSFVPAELDEHMASHLINVYLDCMKTNVQCHDKIEFDLVFTVWTPTFEEEAREQLGQRGFCQNEIMRLGEALKKLTANSLLRLDQDISPIAELAHRREKILMGNNHPIDKFYDLLDDCKQFGTIAFAHAARAGFVAATLLKSFVKSGMLSQCRWQELMQSVKTVARALEEDKLAYENGAITLEQLVAQYGHLRPGTYELTSEAYWENPKFYFSASSGQSESYSRTFTLSGDEATAIAGVLKELNARISPDQLVEYLMRATESREWTKFEFTKNLSAALDQLVKSEDTLGIDRELISFLEYRDLEMFKLNLLGKEAIRSRALQQREHYLTTQLVELPSLLVTTDDFYAFERYPSTPNFVTTKRVCGVIVRLGEESWGDLSQKIVLIPQADPGYDWVFSQNIAGLITQYGGANSHMAIRAAEMNLPVAIGVGEKLYEKICAMSHIELDCANQVIRPL